VKELPYKNGEIVQLLWTGGFDSTCLLILLLEQGVDVIPIYIQQNGVKVQAELEVQRQIREALWTAFGKRVRETKILAWDQAPGTHYTEGQPPKVSWQYPWLLACAPNILGMKDRTIELGVVAGDGQGAANHIAEILAAYNGYLKALGFRSGIRAAFAESTKKQILDVVPEKYHRLLERTWTCERPVSGSGGLIVPCGGEDCTLCKDRIVPAWGVKVDPHKETELCEVQKHDG